ncbi:RICIN domain-containing protein [[Mycobacterium] holstebronense]|uniref:RICIN domain-containing protein n=1 Tax=[Mycobacterium] holstebronense TaxID=3064288 RepID=A0ABN9NS92_9MYCO|nr:RICIN domain-containing protein [Mycolicibacter sp. MU0102]CAJ1509781.1 RICIN domain-containing protein [Mycolicibacter sp. MU0102]
MHRLRVMGGVGRVLAALGTALCVAVGVAGLAAADGPVRLSSRLGDFCLDAPSANYFAAVVVNPCGDSDSQRWYLNGRQLQNVAFPGGCLINPAGDGLFAHLGPCIGMWDQNWNLDPNGQVTTDPGWLCLAVLGGPGPGTWVSTRYCDGDPSQGWDVIS